MKSERLKVGDLVQINGSGPCMLVHNIDPGDADVFGIPDGVICVWEDEEGDQWGMFERRLLKVADKAELLRQGQGRPEWNRIVLTTSCTKKSTTG